MSGYTEIAYAKINLALHVRRRRDDGYHDLETLFAFAQDGDIITGELADDVSLMISGPFAEGLSEIDNLVIRAAAAMRFHFSITNGARLTLEKKLPVASGIGGGSADAAAAARLLNRLWNIGATAGELEQLLAPLGADIPACVRSRTVFGGGIGTDLQAIGDSNIAGRPLLLVNPLQPVSTAAVFKGWDGIDRGELAPLNAWTAALAGRNDLQVPAVQMCPEIGDVLDCLNQTAVEMVRMSGSGATCFALFASADLRDAAQRQIGKACPNWWTMASSLR